MPRKWSISEAKEMPEGAFRNDRSLDHEGKDVCQMSEWLYHLINAQNQQTFAGTMGNYVFTGTCHTVEFTKLMHAMDYNTRM